MQRAINLLEIYNIFENKDLLSNDDIKAFLQIKNTKTHEIECIYHLCKKLKDINEESFEVFEGYYVNYKIPQIGKEFDLIKIGKNKIINIELKLKDIDKIKIFKQLKRNYHYFLALQKDINCYTFVVEYGKIYKYEPEELREINMLDLFQDIQATDSENNHPDNLFVPSNYLISPFNNTKSFIENKYFLTNHQESVCQDILEKIFSSSQDIFSISGQAGTGKTLLVYHLAKELMQKYSVIIIHCASLNDGILELNKIGWNIKAIKNIDLQQFKPDIIIVDEAQRISLKQLQEIKDHKGDKTLIFSHDVHQKLNKTNEAERVVEHIEDITGQEERYKLNNKIRHNKAFSYFIKKLFTPDNKSFQDSVPKRIDNIFLYYIENIEEAERYINFLVRKDWQHIYLSTDIYNPDKLDNVKFSSDTSSHKAIGQEWDKIVTTITQDFYYQENGELAYSARYYYNPLETLFQALTRVRNKLAIVIINNPIVYIKCVGILEEINAKE